MGYIVPPASQSDDPQEVISRVMDAPEPRPQRIVENLETENPVPNDTPVISKIRRSSRIAQKIKARENMLKFKTAQQPKKNLKVHQGMVHMDESRCQILAASITEAAAGTAFVANPSSSSSRILHGPP
ncbi:unnamed protein product [Orchesella dallaii]|uniref:Uncharacterized protein n=1 Tax=Orchesella dallaii TaxID=48710 RepID=A0ABP1RS27_9HEXA